MSTAAAAAMAGTGEGNGSGNSGGSNSAAGGSGGTGAGQGSGNTGASGSGATGAAGTGTAAAGATASWRDSLPEDIRGNPAISSFSDVASLAKSHIHAQSVIGKKGAIAPADWSKATPEERAGFYQAVGGPAADKYEVKLPENVKVPDEMLKGFKEVSFKAGILPHQATEQLGWFTKLDIDRQKAHKQSLADTDKKAIDGLRQEWGDGYDRNIQAAVLASTELLGPEFTKLLNQREFGNNPVVLKALQAAGKKFLSEEKFREGGLGDGNLGRTEIQAQIDEIRFSEAFQQGKHPNHKTAVSKLEGLAKQLTGGR